MKVGVATSSATEALFSNPMRSLLTMLGIIIGVASVMVMMSIGEGAKAQIEAQISSVGANVLNLQPGWRRSWLGLRLGSRLRRPDTRHLGRWRQDGHTPLLAGHDTQA